MKRTTIIRYHAETCAICGGKLNINDGAVRWCEKDKFGIADFTNPKFAHPHCDNPDEDNFTVAAPRIVGRQSDIHPDDEYADRPSLAHHIKR